MMLVAESSVEAGIGRPFAWRFWTDVSNWSDPPAEFSLEGPFEAGSWGVTRMPGQEPIRWILREIQPGEAGVIEMNMNQAALRFEWRFDEAAAGKTRLTQRILFSGQDMAAYDQAKAIFAANLEPGMKRIARLMEEAQARSAIASEA